ncbi:MAG: class I SAM-dependent methyltransferase [Myxococcota bacterium]|nr:class I SAM-dependent methyltransferase [Myxococcota bacterium]
MAADPVGNVYDKYGTRNPLAAAMMRGFLQSLTALYASVAARSVLEVGCGEGRLATYLLRNARRPERFVASDVTLAVVDRDIDPMIELREASALDLPFADQSFDLVICCEVLEHLRDPKRGLAEVTRVARRAVLISAPREPLWRALNVARGRYLRALGNTPGHVQHFSRRGLERLASLTLRVVERRSPPPWTVLLGVPLQGTTLARAAEQQPRHEW